MNEWMMDEQINEWMNKRTDPPVCLSCMAGPAPPPPRLSGSRNHDHNLPRPRPTAHSSHSPGAGTCGPLTLTLRPAAPLVSPFGSGRLWPRRAARPSLPSPYLQLCSSVSRFAAGDAGGHGGTRGDTGGRGETRGDAPAGPGIHSLLSPLREGDAPELMSPFSLPPN